MTFLWFALDSWRASIAPKFFVNFKTSCLIIPCFLAKDIVSLYAPQIGWFLVNVHKFSPKTCCNSNHFLWPPLTTNFTFLADKILSLHLACQCHRCFVVAMDPSLDDHWCTRKCQEKTLTMLNFIMISWCVLEVIETFLLHPNPNPISIYVLWM